MKKIDSYRVLKGTFWFGTIADTIVAINWFLIATGYSLPNILTGHTGTGMDYRIGMYTSGMFMLGWGVILAWGTRKPVERRGLLLITVFFLMASLILELIFLNGAIEIGKGFLLGAINRGVIIAIMSYAYFLSSSKKLILIKNGVQPPNNWFSIFCLLCIDFIRYLFRPEYSSAEGEATFRYRQGYTGRFLGALKAIFWAGSAIVTGFYIAQL